jgi:glucose/arabinose dehydrogenase
MKTHPFKRLRPLIAAVFCVSATGLGAEPAAGPLRVHPTNPRYFADGTKSADGSIKAVYLTGSHTWNVLQDSDDVDSRRFDYNAFLNLLARHNHNFFRLWTRMGTGGGPPVALPTIYERTGPGKARDGEPKYDLNRFNKVFFERVRARVKAAGDRGIYVAVVFFAGDNVVDTGGNENWPLHPYHKDNNVNGINGDPNGDGQGRECYRLQMPAITALQEAYVKNVVETVGDLDNVIWEVGNELPGTWEFANRVARVVKNHERTRPKQHLIGISTFADARPPMRDFGDTPADWLTPDTSSGDYQGDPPAADGKKIIISDTDHLWGVGGDADWVWKTFLRGMHPIYMDPLDKDETREGARRAMGHTRRFAERMNLAAMTPQNALSSTKYCLSNPGKEYLAYQPGQGEFMVDIADGTYAVVWFDTSRGKTVAADSVTGGARRRFNSPFDGAAVLHLKVAASKNQPAASRPDSPAKVVSVAPRDGATRIGLDPIVQVHFSQGLSLKTLSAESVQLLDSANKPISAQIGSDLEGDVVNIRPKERLRPQSVYTVIVNDRLIDKNEKPVASFRSSFTTGRGTPSLARADGFQFSKAKIDDERGPTAVAVGPDGNVYVATYDGILYRLRIDPHTGLATGKDRLLNLSSRKILGLVFDPGATSAEMVAWITYDDRKAEALDVGTFGGVVSKVHIPPAGQTRNATETQYIVGLPSGWHPLNGCTFGPDKRLYVSVGSMNRLGDDPIRPETPLSSAVVVADVRDNKFNEGVLPLNVQTTAPVEYNPYAASAPLKLFATGFRQMYRVCWHSNGSLYGGVNQNDGTGRADTPSAPLVPSLRSVFPDEDLVRIVEGGYYGHPNPSRKEFVLLGGNPTESVDPWEVPEYPVGVQPDSKFNPANLIFNLKSINGTSANGCAEYTLPGPLRGRLLICFYEGTQTIHTFAFNRAGTAVTDERPLLDEKKESLRFTHPLDLAVHKSGRIYVADFGDWGTFGDGGAVWALSAIGSK